jgi:DNA-binding NtrC family response regulator
MITPCLSSKEKLAGLKNETVKKTILLVDSQEESRLIMSSLLKEEGHLVSTCSDSPAAINLIATEPFDFAIVEHAAPGLDGLDLLERIKQHNVRIPVLLISAKYELEPYLVAMNLGALDFFGKPVDYGEIQRLIKTYA